MAYLVVMVSIIRLLVKRKDNFMQLRMGTVVVRVRSEIDFFTMSKLCYLERPARPTFRQVVCESRFIAINYMLFNDEGAWIGKHRQEVWRSLFDGYDKRVRIWRDE